VDLLYDEDIVRDLYGMSRRGRTFGQKATNKYLNWHVNRLFASGQELQAGPAIKIESPLLDNGKIRKIAQALKSSKRPLLIICSQAVLEVDQVNHVAAALERIQAPLYLSGMARGLLGRDHPLHMRHKRRLALKEADFVLLAGVPADFRLSYGNLIRGDAIYTSSNRSRKDLTMNRRPNIGVLGDPGTFIQMLARHFSEEPRWLSWQDQLQKHDQERNEEITQQALEPSGKVNPLHLFRELDPLIGPGSILIADGGDFVATASYILQPSGPLSWLDPGPFGTLGVGAGFALAAKLNRPEAEVWIVYGDGSAGYSLSEFDTFVRHQVPVIALVGNDASWAQIARDQVTMLGDDVGVVLRHSDYHRVAEGFGGTGEKLDDPELIVDVLERAQQTAAGGSPTLINVILGKSDFRKGSISL
jgi:acetolactate synthase-1/2/3 large subunit